MMLRGHCCEGGGSQPHLFEYPREGHHPRRRDSVDHRRRQPSRDDARSPERRKKSPPGPPMTLGNAAAARVRLSSGARRVVTGPSPILLRSPNGTAPETTVPECRERLVCSRVAAAISTWW